MSASAEVESVGLRRGVLLTGLMVVATAVLLGDRVCVAAMKVHMLVVGNNLPRPEQPGAEAVSSGSSVAMLQFADDDAAAFYDLLSPIADSSHLLTVMDSESAARYPRLVTVARPPTMAELTAAIAALAKRLQEDRLRGDRDVLYVYFSGHGSLVDKGGPALTLLDGEIGHRFLYEEILEKLPADYVHLFVDACHAEAIVRPRDAEARSIALTPAEADAFLTRSTLARYPHVGAIVAASVDAQAHEWDALGHGVFTYELLSALRGGADVNRDGKIEYSEIYAFLGAANRGVQDPRARLRVVAHPPAFDRHVPVLDLTKFPGASAARIRDIRPRAGLVEIEDAEGRRLASLRSESDFVTDLLVPPGTTYVRIGDQEARFDAGPSESVSFDSLAFRNRRARSRGALEDSVRRGLFASQFGRGYYLGFIDQAPEFASVSFANEAVRLRPTEGATAGGVAVAAPSKELFAGLGVGTTIASAFTDSPAVRLGLRPRRGDGVNLTVDLARATAADIGESRVATTVGWLWSARLGVARGWLGVVGGGGFIVQTATAQASRWSGMLSLGPRSGLAVDFSNRLALWLEADLAGMAYRRDGRSAFTFAPSGFAGLSIGL